ncbi:NACHT domain-containing protein [Streptomyces sp. LARHCF252]
MGDVLGTWSVGLGGFLLGIAVLALKDWLGAKAKVLLDFLYRRFAGSRLLRRAALAKYTREVYRRHKEFPVSFQVDEALKLPMTSVYVPLRGGSGDQLAASLREARHSVVLGVPGAGKTMLLRHEALMWARQRIREGRRRVDLGDLRDIPVLLELHRLNKDATAGLEQHIVRHFERHGFPRAGTWVAGALDRGDLALYLDGLDEVNSDIRDRIVDMIKDFAETHPECRLVVTCRVAVYEGQFTEFHQTLRVQDFDEHLIRRFLGGWPWQAGTASDSVEQLLGALRDTPQIMSLARNPLLLTMIAYLYDFVYAGTDQALPHTRSEFYKQVIDNLLIDRRRQSVFPHPLKKAVLRRLALVAQDVPSDTHDRLALPEAVVLSTTRTVLERQGRDPLQAEEVIREIAHRSGLLLVVDNGERYQFAHLTLQECLAAIELAAEPHALLRRYTADPQAWRETVRLWCGVEPHDSSEVIRQVFSGDPVLAFQCLADAHTVDDSLAEEILGHFRARLGTSGGPGDYGDEAEIAAFGLVAADRRRHGTEIFEFLRRTATETGDSARARAAARALAATNLPQVAEVLSRQLSEPTDPAWLALASMGDLAVPAFSHWSRWQPEAYRTLWSIRTPKAALALNERLWKAQQSQDLELIAFHLGELLTVPEIAAALRTASVPPAERGWDWEWVWRPFAQGPDDALVRIAGRIAEILYGPFPYGQVPPDDAPAPDPRLLAPLVIVDDGYSGWWGSSYEAGAPLRVLPEQAIALHSVLPDLRVDRTAPDAPVVHSDEFARLLESEYLTGRERQESEPAGLPQVLDTAWQFLQSAGLSERRTGLAQLLPPRWRLRVLVALLHSQEPVDTRVWDAKPDELRSHEYVFLTRNRYTRSVFVIWSALSALGLWRAQMATSGARPLDPVWPAWAGLVVIGVGWLAPVVIKRGPRPLHVPAAITLLVGLVAATALSYVAMKEIWNTPAAVIGVLVFSGAWIMGINRSSELRWRHRTRNHPVRRLLLDPLL